MQMQQKVIQMQYKCNIDTIVLKQNMIVITILLLTFPLLSKSKLKEELLKVEPFMVEQDASFKGHIAIPQSPQPMQQTAKAQPFSMSPLRSSLITSTSSLQRQQSSVSRRTPFNQRASSINIERGRMGSFHRNKSPNDSPARVSAASFHFSQITTLASPNTPPLFYNPEFYYAQDASMTVPMEEEFKDEIKKMTAYVNLREFSLEEYENIFPSSITDAEKTLTMLQHKETTSDGYQRHQLPLQNEQYMLKFNNYRVQLKNFALSFSSSLKLYLQGEAQFVSTEFLSLQNKLMELQHNVLMKLQPQINKTNNLEVNKEFEFSQLQSSTKTLLRRITILLRLVRFMIGEVASSVQEIDRRLDILGIIEEHFFIQQVTAAEFKDIRESLEEIVRATNAKHHTMEEEVLLRCQKQIKEKYMMFAQIVVAMVTMVTEDIAFLHRKGLIELSQNFQFNTAESSSPLSYTQEERISKNLAYAYTAVYHIEQILPVADKSYKILFQVMNKNRLNLQNDKQMQRKQHKYLTSNIGQKEKEKFLKQQKKIQARIKIQAMKKISRLTIMKKTSIKQIQNGITKVKKLLLIVRPFVQNSKEQGLFNTSFL